MVSLQEYILGLRRKNLNQEYGGVSIPVSEENRYKVFSYEQTENGVDRLKWKNPIVELLKKEFAQKNLLA